MYIDDPNNPPEEKILLKNGNKKIIEYHGAGGSPDRKYDATCMTIFIYDAKGNLISKETKLNPSGIYYYTLINEPHMMDILKKDLKKYK